MSASYPASDTSSVTVDGVDVRVRLDGPAEGPRVLLLHGIGRSLEDWAPAQDLLARDHRVAAMDLPGFGLTRKLRGAPTLAAFAAAVEGVLDALEWREPVVVMGNSLGGAVAMTLAVSAPTRVSRLVLVNSAGFGREASISLAPMGYAALAALPVVGPRFRARASRAGLKSLTDIFHDPAHVTPDFVRHSARVSGQPDWRGTFIGTASRLGVVGLGMYPGWRRALLSQVAALPLPVLVVWGDDDKVLPTHHLQAASLALPSAQTHLFAATGHMPQLERPEEFCSVVAPFIG